ncbi:DUF6049 family protein [Trueperella pecoris]|uniref:Secreted protein n=1 Tax=Trueperella pecoris TaxID=2733571 RepID=A0A7M1QWE4_9ACTO|nr:DUF6049 family protein [Trueperella pecoris]QOR45655.1 hypothetical protein INS88_10495 [Trueperella pecoris]QTG75496.1 hypothetical protein J4179_09920 [Trueperella pecoris]
MRRRRLPAVALTIAMLSVASAAALAAPAAAAPADTTATADAQVGQPHLRISEVASPVLAPNGDLTLTVEVTNPTDRPLELAGFDLLAQVSTSISDTSIHRWMDGTTPARRLATVDSPLTIAPGKTIDKSLVFARAELPWPSGPFQWGPRGIEIAARGEEDIASDRTMIVAGPDAELNRFPATAVVPITDTSIVSSPTANTILWETDKDRTAWEATRTKALALVVDRLASWDVPGITLAVDPELKLRSLQAEQVSLPSYDADVAALSALGLTEQATRLASGALFLPEGAPSKQALAYAQSLGMTLLIPDAVYAPLPQTYTPGALTTFGEDSKPVISTNSTISAALAGKFAVSGEGSIELDALDTRQVSLALSAAHYRQRPNDPRPYVMTVPRGADLAAEAAVKAVLDSPWVEKSTVSKILGGTPDTTARTFVEPEPAAGMLSAVDQAKIEAGLSSFENFSTIFADGPDKVAAAKSHADTLTSLAWRSASSARNAQILSIAPTPDQLRAIAVSTSSTINLISESSGLPIQVTNDFPDPVTVTVHLNVPDNRLRAPQPVEVTLPASSTTIVSVPVEAHGSGNLDVEVRLTNAAGTPVGSSEVLHVRVRADWENVGTAILAGLVGVVFVVGLVKSVRDGRRSDPVPADDFVAATKH